MDNGDLHLVRCLAGAKDWVWARLQGQWEGPEELQARHVVGLGSQLVRPVGGDDSMDHPFVGVLVWRHHENMQRLR